MINANSDPFSNMISCLLPWSILNTVFEVEANSFAIVSHKNSEGTSTKIYGPGCHSLDCFHKLQGIYNFHSKYTNNII
jgi:hypothetical protein